jgi:signal transduction histidine kinase/HAMP domain-containing protein
MRDNNSNLDLRRRWGLSARLTAVVVLIFVAIFAASILSHLQYRDDRKDSRVESVQQVSQTVAALFDGFTSDLEAFSLSTAITLGEADVSTDPADSAELQPEVRPYLQRLFNRYGVLRAIFVTNPDGVVVLSTSDAGIGSDLGDRGYIRALQDGMESYWSSAFPGIESGNTTVAHSRQIVSPEGDTIGFLVIVFYPQELATRLPPELGSEGHVTLVDRNGVVLLQIPEPPEYTLQPDFESWPALVAEGRGELLVEPNDAPLAPGDSYGALARMDGLGWTVGYTVPADVVEGAGNSIFQRDLVILGAVLLASLAAVLFIAQRLGRTVSRLAEAATAIGRGDPAPNLLKVSTSDRDVGVLASSMDRMQRAIVLREKDLRTQTSILEAIESMGESLARELDLDKTVQAITECGLEIAGAESAIFLRPEDGRDAPYLEPTSVTRRVTLHSRDPLIDQVFGGMAIFGEGESPHQAAGATANGTRQIARSVIGIPIRARSGTVQAALLLLHSDPGAFSSQSQRLALGLGRWAEIVLENASFYQQSVELTERLQEANEAKDEFLAMLSHELRTPITTIYGGARLLKVRRSQLPENAIEEMITSVAEESEHLYRLVEDLLALARTEMSREVEVEPVSIPSIIEQAASDLGRRSSRDLAIQIDEGVPDVIAEPTYLLHVIYNLLSNAEKYSPPDDPIEVQVTLEDDEVFIRVMDRGPGVPEEELPQIFDRFFRSADVSKSQLPGKGLGLTVCRRLVEALSGRIWAVNRDGGGFEVGFALPATTATEPAAATD